MSFKSKKVYVVFLLLVFVPSAGLADALLLTAPPRESPQAGEQLYGPLARHLSELTGKAIVYQHPRNWLHYQRDIRYNRFDIVFDGPHFASWRIKHLAHTPVAKLPGILKFYLVARTESDDINKPKDLAARKVCVIPPPNLSSLVLLARTDGPAREPILEGVKGGMKSVLKELFDRQCEAAMLRSSFFDKKLNDQQRAKLKVIYSSQDMPNQVITVSDKFNAEQQALIATSLTTGDGIVASQNVVKRFAGKQTQSFIGVENGEYDGYNELLEGVILGWKKRE